MIARVLPTGHVPVKLWTNDVEVAALEQLRNTAGLPCVFKHVAAMPDVHFGIGATVGSVVATKGAIIPAAVGVDIGCGMMAAKLPFTASQLPDNLKDLFDDICWGVPVGKNAHKVIRGEALTFLNGDDFSDLPEDLQGETIQAAKQLGTLGGGNHFIEICLDEHQRVWVMLHSGSRGIGNKIGRHYIDHAKKIAEVWFIQLADPNLAYLAEGTVIFDEYWRALQWAQRYAMKNREMMMKRVLQAVAKILLNDWQALIEPDLMVNCHHNYAEREHHFGHNVIVTRKGAIRAREGDYGIIPGSMGSRSYIVRGRGNLDSFCSCSHGAGRRMSRTEARNTFTAEDVATQTEGVVCRKDAGVVDEAPGAYKDIDEVMANQQDLVTIEATLKQVLCVKG